MGTPTIVRAVEAQLANINRDLAELKDRVSRVGSTAKQKAVAALQGLPEKRDELAQRFASLKDSLAEASEGVRSELVEACRELRKAVEKALDMTPAPDANADTEGNDAERSEGDSTDRTRPRPEVRRWQ